MKNQKETISERQQALVDQLISCAFACEQCFSQCLQEEDVSMMTRCIELDRDCADLCTQAARLIYRGSEVSDMFLQTCSEVCRLCSQECRKHEVDHCQRCADACVACANACQEYQGRPQLTV